VLLASEPATGTAGVAATKGLTVSGAGGTTKLPATAHGRRVAAWRVRGDGGTLRLGARYGGAWHHVATPPLGPAASFRAPSRMLTMQTAAGTRSYRGRLDVTLSDGALVAIDRVGLEGYVAGVVPDEMPPSWPAAALKAQAVAARSYAAYEIAHPRSSRWDAYADSRDQAYGGVTTETSSTDDATRATAGEIRVDRSGQAIFAAYGAADGGETVPGTVAGAPADYLPAQADPYDDLEPNSASAWTATITRSALAGAYPSVGKPRSVTVDARDGRGQWGGRISELTVHGTAGSVRVSGVSFAYSLGLRSPWWAASTKSGASTSGAVLPGGAGTETDGF
jgi:SpoIID/LytB domain protein